MTTSRRRKERGGRSGTSALVLAGVLTLAGIQVNAASYGGSPSSTYYVSAPVVNVSPITTERTIRHPVRQCTIHPDDHREHRYERRQENLFLPGLFGGIVGGLIGNQFGGGSGKKALTVVGALAGSSIARDAARQQRHSDRPTEVCHTSYRTEVVRDVTAYDVTYEYAGELFEKRMSEHPGSAVQVRVALEPAYGGP